MPMPVSSTSRRNMPESAPSSRVNEARTSMKPSFVNFAAFPTKLNSICRMRCGSTIRTGRPSALQRISSCAFLFARRNDSTISFSKSLQSVGSGTISMRPDSSFEKSSTSLMRHSSVLPLTRMESTAWLRSTSVLKPILSICEKPMIALRGVRISWLIVEKK